MDKRLITLYMFFSCAPLFSADKFPDAASPENVDGPAFNSLVKLITCCQQCCECLKDPQWFIIERTNRPKFEHYKSAISAQKQPYKCKEKNE